MKTKIILWTLGVLLVIVAALGVTQYVVSARNGEAALIGDVTVTPAEISLGSEIHLSIECRVPWGQSVRSLTCQPGHGLVLYGTPKWTLAGIGREARRVRLEIVLRAFRTGELDAGEGKVVIERPVFAHGARQLEFALALPKLTVKPLDVKPGSELPVAGAIAPAAKVPGKWLWIGGGILFAVLIALVIWLIWFKRHKEALAVVLPPWEIARGELAVLRQTADTGDRPLPWCVARLTDVVRDYLSARFAWPVTQQTTGEFLNSLRRAKESPLSAEQMRSLGDFMNAADLVKFAKMEPDAGYFRDAMHRAETLIDETQLRETPEMEKEAKK